MGVYNIKFYKDSKIPQPFKEVTQALSKVHPGKTLSVINDGEISARDVIFVLDSDCSGDLDITDNVTRNLTLLKEIRSVVGRYFPTLFELNWRRNDMNVNNGDKNGENISKVLNTDWGFLKANLSNGFTKENFFDAKKEYEQDVYEFKRKQRIRRMESDLSEVYKTAKPLPLCGFEELKNPPKDSSESSKEVLRQHKLLERIEESNKKIFEMTAKLEGGGDALLKYDLERKY